MSIPFSSLRSLNSRHRDPYASIDSSGFLLINKNWRCFSSLLAVKKFLGCKLVLEPSGRKKMPYLNASTLFLQYDFVGVTL